MTREKFLQSFIIGFAALVLSFGIHAHPAIQAQTPVSAADLIQESKGYYDLGQFSAATTALQRALQTYKSSGDKLQEARTLSLLSLAYEQLGMAELVDKTIDSSLSLLEEILEAKSSEPQRDRVQAQILNRQGRWQLAKGEAEASLETSKQAEVFYTRANDVRGIAIARLNQAQAWQTLGFSRRATKILDKLSSQLQSQPSSVVQLSTLNSLGNLYRQQGNLGRSEQILTQSLTLAKNLNPSSQTSKILLSLGNIKLTKASQAQNLNNPEQVINYQQQALEYYQEAAVIATFPLNKVQAQLNQLSLLIATKNLAQAEDLLTPISNNLKQLLSSRQSIYARINFARSLMKIPEIAGEKIKITEILNTAIAQAQSLADRRAESSATGTLGEFYATTAQTSLAKKSTTSAIAMVQNIYAPDLSYKLQWQLGRLLAQENKTREAIVAYSEATEDLQLLRFDLASTNPELQFSFRDSVEPVYREFIGLLLSSPQPSQENLQRSVRVIEELKVAELDNLFRDACAQADTIDISQFDDNTAIIYPFVLQERLELVLKLPNQAELYHYSQPSISKSEIDRAAEQLQRSLLKRSTSPSQLKEESARLYNWLIKPFAQELEITSSREASQIKNLVFVLDGSLRNVPMSALYDGQNYLIDRYSVAVSPGVQLVKPESLARDNLKILLAGAVDSPSFKTQNLAPLSNVSFELEGIAKTIKRNEKLEDKEFLQTNIQERINNDSFNIVHIATHGRFSSNSQETYILDWDKAIGLNDLDKLLETEDFSRAKAIDLLVLSACETATGDRQAALGLAGVAVRSGASSTIASLWQVNDASTAQFMIEFYKQLNNTQLTKAEALRNTQLNFLAKSSADTDYNRPYHWASFILVGDWR